MSYCPGPFGMIPHAVIDAGMSPYAVTVYAHLARYADRQTGRCYPGLRRIAKKGNMSINTVRKAIAELEARGFIAVFPSGKGKGGGKGQAYSLAVSPRDTGTSEAVSPGEQAVSPQGIVLYHGVTQNENQLTKVSKREKPRDQFGHIQDRTPTPSCLACGEPLIQGRVVFGNRGGYCSLEHKGVKEGLSKAEQRDAANSQTINNFWVSLHPELANEG